MFTILPTQVGVFPMRMSFPSESKDSPHASGGVSHDSLAEGKITTFSPRKWGCF